MQGPAGGTCALRASREATRVCAGLLRGQEGGERATRWFVYRCRPLLSARSSALLLMLVLVLVLLWVGVPCVTGMST